MVLVHFTLPHVEKPPYLRRPETYMKLQAALILK